jgi:hypothetical protein
MDPASKRFFSTLLLFSLFLSFASSYSLHSEEQQDKEDVFIPRFPSFHQSWQAQIVVNANLTNSNGKVEHSWYGTATER